MCAAVPERKRRTLKDSHSHAATYTVHLIIVILGIRRIANGVSETPAWYSMAGHSFGEAVTSSTEFQYSSTHSLKRPLAKVRQRLPQDSAHAYRILCAIYASRIFFSTICQCGRACPIRHLRESRAIICRQIWEAAVYSKFGTLPKTHLRTSDC